MLTFTMKQKRLKKCRALLKRLAGGTHRVVLSLVATLFSIKQKFNQQNYQISSKNVVIANSYGRIIQKSVHQKSFMMLGRIPDDSKIFLVLVKLGVKFNQYFAESIQDFFSKTRFWTKLGASNDSALDHHVQMT